MSFEIENGHIPQTFAEIMNELRTELNTQFKTNYTEENFVGTNWYKFLYAPAQKIQAGEIKTADIFLKLSQYISLTNERIQRPSVSYPGLIDSFELNGWVASVKKNEIGDAGTISVCVDVDNTAEDYPVKKLEICNLIKRFVVGGMISLGTETESITLRNGQNFDFSFFLPLRKAVKVKVTVKISDNTLVAIPDDEEIRQKVFDNIHSMYRLGWDFEPQRYFTMCDAPWASRIVFEWSDDDGVTWKSTIFEAGFQDLFEINLEDIQVVIQ